MTTLRIEGDSAPPYAFEASAGFASWLHQQGVTLALTTYDIGKVFLISADEPDRLRILERTFDRAMGLAITGSSLVLATKNALVRFENVVPKGQTLDGQDSLFIPQALWITGDAFAHDVGLTSADRPVFVNTSFSCLAAVDERSSFRPFWKPPFISQYAPQDRCHLNGLAMENGQPQYVTMIAATNEGGAWRNYRVGGGLVMDVRNNTEVARNLSMPHSPRLRDGKIWLLQAGTGELGFIVPQTGAFEAAAFCPGFVRGLAFQGNHALVGTSLPRTNALFTGLPLEDGLASRKLAADCAVHVVNLNTGAIDHVLRLGGAVREFYEVAIIPGLTRAGLLGIGHFGAGVPDLTRLSIKGPELFMDCLLAPALPP
jgi:uncharacterized protein (TIGR03032 family)